MSDTHPLHGRTEQMAEALRVSSRSQYAPFLDGAAHRLRAGVEFHGSAVNARSEIYRVAKRRWLRVQARIDGMDVIVQARP